MLSYYVFTFVSPCCAVRYDFRIKTMFGSSSPPVGCRRAPVLSILFMFVNSVVQHILCCVYVLFDFFLCSVSNVQCVSGLSIWIATSVFSNIYLDVTVFSDYPHTSMEFVIVMLNVVLDTNNVAILVE